MATTTAATTTAAIASEVHNPVIPAGYDLVWTISMVVVLLAIVAAVWFLVRAVKRSRSRSRG
jgi:flagellar biogenesis protein FliO